VARGQLAQDGQSRTTGTQSKRNRTTVAGQPGQDSQKETAEAGQVIQNRTTIKK
jgi:hypothetical protein